LKKLTITSPSENDPNLIPWSKDYKITWDDFQGKPDRKYAKELEKFGAKVTATIDHRLNWAIDDATTKIKVQIIEVKVRCFFNKKLSWVRKSLLSKDKEYLKTVLNHEQGHLDLAEEHVRLMESKLKLLQNKKFSVHGKNLEEQLMNTQATKEKLDKKFYNQLEELWKNDDANYDEETNHGNIKEMQIKWDDRFSKLRN